MKKAKAPNEKDFVRRHIVSRIDAVCNTKVAIKKHRNACMNCLVFVYHQQNGATPATLLPPPPPGAFIMIFDVWVMMGCLVYVVANGNFTVCAHTH